MMEEENDCFKRKLAAKYRTGSAIKLNEAATLNDIHRKMGDGISNIS